MLAVGPAPADTTPVAVPQGAGPTVVDARPDIEKTSEMLSGWASSCKYAIFRIGDEKTVPPRLEVLRQDLEEALGPRITSQTIAVTHYTVFLNEQARAIGGNPFAKGLVGAVLNPRCSQEETGGGWYSPSEETSSTNAPLVLDIDVSVSGKSYRVRLIYWPENPIIFRRGSPEILTALHQIDAMLIKEMRDL